MAKARAGHSTVSRAIGGAAGWRGRFDRVRQQEACASSCPGDKRAKDGMMPRVATVLQCER